MELLLEIFFLGAVVILLIAVPIWLKERKLKKELISSEPNEDDLTLKELIEGVELAKTKEQLILFQNAFIVNYTPFPKRETNGEIPKEAKEHFLFLEKFFLKDILSLEDRRQIMEDFRGLVSEYKVEIGFLWRRLHIQN
jgi:hypothetical protein